MKLGQGRAERWDAPSGIAIVGGYVGGELRTSGWWEGIAIERDGRWYSKTKGTLLRSIDPKADVWESNQIEDWRESSWKPPPPLGRLCRHLGVVGAEWEVKRWRGPCGHDKWSMKCEKKKVLSHLIAKTWVVIIFISVPIPKLPTHTIPFSCNPVGVNCTLTLQSRSEGEKMGWGWEKLDGSDELLNDFLVIGDREVCVDVAILSQQPVGHDTSLLSFPLSISSSSLSTI